MGGLGAILRWRLASPVLGLVYGTNNVTGVLLASALVVALSAALVDAHRLPRRTCP